jgi:Domain of unknown function (DUF5666)
MIKRTKMTVLTGVATLALAGVGTGIAFAQSTDPPTPTPSPPSSPEHHGARHGHGGYQGLLGRIEHGEATVDTGNGTQVVDLQRGTVDSASPDGLTVRSADGFTATYTVNNSTKIRKDRKASDISQVATNDRVIVLATKAGNTVTATRINDTGPAK